MSCVLSYLACSSASSSSLSLLRSFSCLCLSRSAASFFRRWDSCCSLSCLSRSCFSWAALRKAANVSEVFCWNTWKEEEETRWGN